LARAKNTDRAEARRRTREQQRAVEVQPNVLTTDATTVAVDAGPSVGTSMRSSLRMPNVLEDLRALPGMILHTPKVWIPFIALLVSFILAMLLPRSTTIFIGPGQFGTVLGTTILPSGTDTIAALFVQLTLPPTALFIFFIGGFLAPRASYLVGALLGLVDGIFWAIFQLSAGSAADDTSGGLGATSISDVVAIVFFAMVIGILAAGFAAWYRNFLRQSQERARANRASREAQRRAKAKEDEREAKEDQRKAATEARDAARAAKSSSKGTPPTG